MSSFAMPRAFVCALVVLLVAQQQQQPALAAKEVQLPRNVYACKHESSDYSSCLRLAIQESWLTFVKGIPDLELPVLDPIVLDIVDNDYRLGDVQGKFVMRDVKSYGLAKAHFLAVRPRRSGNQMSLEVDIEIPRVFIDGYYKAEGLLGTYKIGGKGYFNISMESVSATWNIEGSIKNDRWVVEHFNLYPEVEQMKVYFSDFFNGNEELNKAALSFVNSYWPSLYKGMLPTVQKQWDQYLTEFVNRLIFSKISFSKVFP